MELAMETFQLLDPGDFTNPQSRVMIPHGDPMESC